jgi:hypothetical protein
MTRYSSFTDASGGRGDSFANAIAHAEGDLVFLDCVYEKRAPFDPGVAVREVAELLRSYGIAETTGDRYAANWVTEGFAKEGIRYLPAERDRSSIYLDVLPLFTASRVRLLDIPRSTHQFASLQRRVSAIGRDRVGHSPGGSDDVANAISGALVLAVANAGPALWRRQDLMSGETLIEWPIRCDAVFATAGIDHRGLVVCFWASGAECYGGPQTLLIDYRHSRLTPTLFGEVAARLGELVQLAALAKPQWRPMTGSIIVGSILAAHAEAAGLTVIDGDRLLAPRATLVLGAAAQIGLGVVKICTLADAASLNVPLPLGEVRADAVPTAAGDAALLGIGGTLPYDMQPPEWKRAA